MEISLEPMGIKLKKNQFSGMNGTPFSQVSYLLPWLHSSDTSQVSQSTVGLPSGMCWSISISGNHDWHYHLMIGNSDLACGRILGTWCEYGILHTIGQPIGQALIVAE